LILILKTNIKDRSLRQLLQVGGVSFKPARDANRERVNIRVFARLTR
jgi:hypothetical protein